GDILNRFSSDVNSIATNAITWIPSLLVSLFNFVATFVVIYSYDVTMAWLSLASAPILVAASSILMTKMRNYSKRLRVLSSQVLSFEQEAFGNMTSIKSFGISDLYADALGDWQGKYRDYSLDYNMFSIKTNILLSVIAMATQFLTYGWGVYRLWGGFITYGEMTLFLSQSSRLSSAFNSVCSMLPTALNSSVSARRVIELTDLPREKHSPEAVSEMEKVVDGGLTVRMEDVFFEYEPTNNVFREANFKAAPGEIIGVIGASGKGKTTMMRILLGLVFPGEGSAFIEDKYGHRIEANADTRRFIAYVPQGNTIMSGTVAENVRMVEKDATDEEVVQALKDSCAWEFVEDLSDGIDSNIFERGGGLSEGQAQRIAIARAVIRKVPILLLDEATSALDMETEKNVLRNIIKNNPHRTIIVSTHRPSVLHQCDRVYRIRDNTLSVASTEEVADIYREDDE
nr:ABC transporter ATP-binding protein/permease [Eubacterium sp.]